MKLVIIVIGFFAIVVGLVLAFPDYLINPGPLMQGHAQIEKNCLSCHRPFRGALTMQCTNCHKPDEIGIKNVKGMALLRKDSNISFHRGLSTNSCIGCHTDHKGRDSTRAIRAFRHEGISFDLRANCNSCHDVQKPKDKLHDYATRSCGECHSTSGWKPASFDHKTLASAQRCIDCHKGEVLKDHLHSSAGDNCSTCHGTSGWKPASFDHKMLASAQRCIDCHKGEVPKDRLHSSTGANCSTCHGTRAWRPASFDHDRYFRLDRDHRASCSTCHKDSSDFKKYTCYGCHEHTPSNIASEHREEGIRNYQNCMRCHKSGSDED